MSCTCRDIYAWTGRSCISKNATGAKMLEYKTTFWFPYVRLRQCFLKCGSPTTLLKDARHNIYGNDGFYTKYLHVRLFVHFCIDIKLKISFRTKNVAKIRVRIPTKSGPTWIPLDFCSISFCLQNYREMVPPMTAEFHMFSKTHNSSQHLQKIFTWTVFYEIKIIARMALSRGGWNKEVRTA